MSFSSRGGKRATSQSLMMSKQRHTQHSTPTENVQHPATSKSSKSDTTVKLKTTGKSPATTKNTLSDTQNSETNKRKMTTSPKHCPAAKKSTIPSSTPDNSDQHPTLTGECMTSTVNLSLESIQSQSSSNSSGIISDNCNSMPSNQPTPNALPGEANTRQNQEQDDDSDINNNQSSTSNEHSLNRPKNPKVARIDLNSPENLSLIPSSARQVYITSTDQNYNLAKMNPIRIAEELKKICGHLAGVDYKASGSLLLTTHNSQQMEMLLKVTKFTSADIPVQVVVAWESQLSQGKLYAPELQGETLDSLLSYLKPLGVVSIRKLFSDPNKTSVPLYVLTFIGKQCPEKITIGYSIYKIDKYYPSPMRCGKCCRWGHTTNKCRSQTICNICGKKDHSQTDCNSEPFCINCKGAHSAFSKTCPSYLQEQEICRITTDRGITFSEARSLIKHRQIHLSQPTAVNVTLPQPTIIHLNSQDIFPNLPSMQTEGPHPSCSNVQASPQLKTSYNNDKIQPTSTRAYSNSTSMQETQSSQWFTAGQGHRKQHPTPNATPNSQTLENHFALSSLPDLPTLTQLNNPHPPTATSSPTPSVSSVIPQSIKQLLVKLIPLLIKLFISNNITDKIECFHEIGSIFEMGSIVAEMLSKMGLTSQSSSQ